ncbi:MAG: DUF167 domain-containing protein [Thermodesulfobium sp.]
MDFKVELRVTPNAKKESVEVRDGKIFCKVGAPPEDGRANKRVLELISKFLDCKKRDIEISSGEKNRNKVLLVKSENIFQKIKEQEQQKI